WLWRVYGDKNAPVVLFDAMGHIKRANEQAIEAFGLSPSDFATKISSLARITMPNLGERRDTIVWAGPPKTVWKLDWPSNSLPLAAFNDVTSHQEEIARLQTQLYTDPMTHEANRAGFERAIAELNDANDETFAIIFMDMNGFKAVNDTYGHDAGDILLKVAGQRFRKVIGPDAVLARLGGDEFAIIVRNVRCADQLLDLRDRLEASLDERVDIGQCTVKVGVAAGYAIRENNQEESASVLRRADHAMYERKAFLKSRPPTLALPPTVTTAPVLA
ncbi:MAG: GGDEF domain-containing protein, partial [Planctomycetaceae bacterium]|nr:GGDEF domain-containing protein [Planctomycetaceae bacterium]